MRRLYPEELEALEKEFVSYLIMNGIEGEDWKKIKKEDQSKAEDIIYDFSYKYFEVMLSGIYFLTLKTSEGVHAINFLKNSMREFKSLNGNTITIAYKESPYKELKTTALKFELMEKGYLPDKGEYFKEMAILYAKQKQE